MKALTEQEIQTALFFLWIILLLPWLLFAPLFGMAFESGEAPTSTYVFVGAIWTYPVAVALAAIFRSKMPKIAFLPFLNVLLVSVLWKSN